MDATTARPATGLLVAFGAPLPNPGIAVYRNLATSRSDVDRVEDLSQIGRRTVYSRRIPRFTNPARYREGSTERRTSSHEFPLPMNAPVMNRSIEKGVR